MTNDVAIIGAGPTGTLLGLLLASRGLRVVLLERRVELPAHSMAIGVTPPSLEILKKAGLDRALVARGVKVSDCHVHGRGGYLGCVTFRRLRHEHPFILSVPQSVTVALLREKLAECAGVTLRTGVEVTGVLQAVDGCLLATSCGGEVRAKYVIACDGSRSAAREWIGARFEAGEYDAHFVMGDFTDRTASGDEAHLWFTADGAVESFPLPGGMRRWIVQTPAAMPDTAAGYISAVVRLRTGISLPADDRANQSAFSPRRLNCARYDFGRVILCGDAAHVMSPIGGQGMNTGFADAEFLAEILPAIILRSTDAGPLLAAYTRCRRVAADAAISRAAMSMKLGTWTGVARSRVRDLFIRLMCSRVGVRYVAPHYAMLTIPCGTLSRLPRTRRRALEACGG